MIVDHHLTARDGVHRSDVRDALLLEHSVRDRIGVVLEAYRYGALDQDRAVVVFVVDEVHGASGELHPRAADRFVNVMTVETLAAERREQGRMDVEDASTPALHQRQFHEVTGKQSEVDSVLVEIVEDRVRELRRARECLAGEVSRRDSERACAFECVAVRSARDAANDLAIELTAARSLAQVLQSPATAGDQYAEAEVPSTGGARRTQGVCSTTNGREREPSSNSA